MFFSFKAFSFFCLYYGRSFPPVLWSPRYGSSNTKNQHKKATQMLLTEMLIVENKLAE